MSTQDPNIYRPRSLIDVLNLPLLGRLLKWRWGRLSLQLPLAIITLLLLVDGFTGPQSPARNLATVSIWVHYRGIVVLVLLLLGNLFCMGCPFTLPRTLAKRFSRPRRRFPKALRNKWIAIASLFVIFLLYEWLDLWASPMLTAWVIAGYFIGSFALEAIFTESAFCKYVCPLGSFNFVYSTTGPTQIGVRDATICQTCVGKECVNGSYAPQTVIRLDAIPGGGQREVVHGPSGTPGCGTLLFAPQVRTNIDCTMCLDCVRACPHDNIGLMLRTPGRELGLPDAWPKRWDFSLMVIILAALGLTNAFGMVPPVFELQRWLAATFSIHSDLILLLIIFGVLGLVVPVVLTLVAAFISQQITGTAKRYSLREITAAFAPAFVPVGLGVWIAHYAFHLLIALWTIIPVFQEFIGQKGDWARFGMPLDEQIISLVQVVAIIGSILWSLYLAQKASLRLFRRQSVPGMLPWVLLLILIAVLAVQIFSLPMEMRGSILMS